jgi:hypothetical protein
MEKAGQLYEAIQFYRRAVQLVPDIEFRLDNLTKKSKVATIPLGVPRVERLKTM